MSALVLDPCTGVATEQNEGVGELRPDAGGRNKFTARIDGTTAVDYAREYRLSASTGTVVTKNGFLAGQYVNPVEVWVQPENLNPSLPPIPNEFSRMTHLTRGIGLDPDTGKVFGPLTPFPQSAVSTFDTSACAAASNESNPIPVIQAAVSLGGDSTTSSTTSQLFVRAGDTAVLSGSQVNPDISESTTTYNWGLIEDASPGTIDDLSSVQLSDDNSTYSIAFSSSAPLGDYYFELNITSSSINNSTNSTVSSSGATNITITHFSGPDTVKVTAVTWSSVQSGTVGVTCTSNYWVDSAVGMTVTVPLDKATGAQVMSATPPNSGTWAFSSRSAPQPGTIICSSKLGGSATQVGQTT